jgi:hypothetical protein
MMDGAVSGVTRRCHDVTRKTDEISRTLYLMQDGIRFDNIIN